MKVYVVINIFIIFVFSQWILSDKRWIGWLEQRWKYFIS